MIKILFATSMTFLLCQVAIANTQNGRQNPERNNDECFRSTYSRELPRIAIEIETKNGSHESGFYGLGSGIYQNSNGLPLIYYVVISNDEFTGFDQNDNPLGNLHQMLGYLLTVDRKTCEVISYDRKDMRSPK